MTIDELAAHLLVRLDKEIARVEAGTVAVGGLTKAGGDLEALLKLCASSYAKGQGSSLEAELRRAGITSKGAGSYAGVLKGARRGSLGHVVAEAIGTDLRAGRSRVQALIELRNDNAHGREPQAYKATLTAVAALLRPLSKP